MLRSIGLVLSNERGVSNLQYISAAENFCGLISQMLQDQLEEYRERQIEVSKIFAESDLKPTSLLKFRLGHWRFAFKHKVRLTNWPIGFLSPGPGFDFKLKKSEFLSTMIDSGFNVEKWTRRKCQVDLYLLFSNVINPQAKWVRP